MRRRRRSTAPQHRLGFTLIELLVVIVILGVLIGLLVPAVMRAVSTAKNAAVAAEIRAMSQALTQFKTQYGEFPPSRIVISESGDYSTATITDPAARALIPRSLQYLRRFWPKMQFNTSGSAGSPAGITAANGGFYDVNGNGNVDAYYMLTGPECLVLFLGGVPQPNGAGWAVTGFSRNPANPFQNSVFTTNRTVPLFEFNNSRLVSNTLNPSATPTTLFPGYIDSLGLPPDQNTIPFYCYFSSYGGSGYDPGDVDFAEASSDGNIPAIAGAFTTNNAPTSAHPVAANTAITASPVPNPYTNAVPVATMAGTGGLNAASKKPAAWQNQQSFQIISPGADRLYGIGGQYIGNGTEKLPFVMAAGSGYLADTFQTQEANAAVVGNNVGVDARYREKDNLSNFSPGTLD